MNEWIDVKDRLPEVDVQVLTLDKRGRIMDRRLYAFASGDLIFYPDAMKIGEDITHWMPLPEPPESLSPKQRESYYGRFFPKTKSRASQKPPLQEARG